MRLMKGIFAANREKREKEKVKRRDQHKKFLDKMKAMDERRDMKAKEQKKKLFRLQGQEEKRRQKQALRSKRWQKWELVKKV